MRQTLVLVFFLGCGGGGASDTDRGGPESLEGVSWRGETIEPVAGLELTPAFRFDGTQLELTNTCHSGGTELQATTRAPVRYHYEVRTDGGSDGGDSCAIEVASGVSTFELDDGALSWTFRGSTVRFQPAGAVAGLYGDWTAENDVGVFRFSLGQGRLRASIACRGGESASVDLPADFSNFLDILEAASVTEESDGVSCTASIAAANRIPYRFDGDTLVMTFDGRDARFEP